MSPKRISNLSSPTELTWFHKAGERGWRPTQRQSQHKLPSPASPLGLGQLYKEESYEHRRHRVSKCSRWSLMSRQRPAEPPHELGAHNKPDTCGSSQNSCPLLHNDAWIKVTFLWAAFCHAAAILVRKSARPYLGSCPTEGQHEGQRDEKAASEGRPGGAAWSHRKPKSCPLLLLNIPTSSSQPDPCLSLPSDCILWVSYSHRHSGEDIKGVEMKSPFLPFSYGSFSARDLKCRTYTGQKICRHR